MPTPTTAATIKAEVIAAVNAITPRTVRGQSQGWKYYDQRTDAKPGQRWYTVRFEVTGHSAIGLWGQAANTVEGVLSIIVDYGGVPEQELDTMAGDDFLQLHDVINALRSSNDGIRTVRAADWDYTDGERKDEAQVTYQFDIRFLKARAA